MSVEAHADVTLLAVKLLLDHFTLLPHCISQSLTLRLLSAVVASTICMEMVNFS